MSRIVVALALLVSIGLSQNHAAPVTIRVLTYNIHHGEGTDGRVELDRLANVMKSARPDLVALQEVDQATARTGAVPQLTELGRLMGMHAEFGKAMDYLGGAYGVGVLSRWPIVSSENHPLPTPPDREPRTALTVRVKAYEHGPLLQFTSTHLDEGRDREIRKIQAAHLNELLVPGDGLPSILAGDLNVRSDSEAMEILAAHWTPAALDEPWSAPLGRRRPPDYVLFPTAEPFRVVESRFIDDRVASDHRPLLTVLEYIDKQ
jgi:endonuclease/exonuclease/phosphatase family metal-dependent hydrolase